MSPLYRIHDLDEYNHMKDVVEGYSQRIIYQGEELLLHHIETFPIRVEDNPPVYYAFCVLLQIKQMNYILVSIKDVYDIIQNNDNKNL